MLGNFLDPIEWARDAAKTPREKGAKKRQMIGIISDIFIDTRNAILNQLISSTSSTWFGQVGTICDVKALSPHDTSGCFSIPDTGSIKPIDKRARKVHDEYTKAVHALDEKQHLDIPAEFKGSIKTVILQHGPSATHPMRESNYWLWRWRFR